MADRTSRRFTMGDLMILIAGVAAGFAWSRAAHFEWGMILNGGDPFYWSTQIIWHHTAKRRLYEASPFVASITIALMVCSTRQPRPRLIRLFRQPGFMAVLAFTVFVAWQAGMHWVGPRLLEHVDQALGEGAGLRQSLSQYPYAHLITGKIDGSGLVIAACWLMLWASRRWRPESTWLDRSGRLLGTYWIAVYVFESSDNIAFY